MHNKGLSAGLNPCLLYPQVAARDASQGLAMRSQQLVDVLKSVVQADVASQNSVIQFYMTHNLSGGWEGWLQTVFARGVFSVDQIADFNREVPYTGSALRCDLWFQGGTGIWVELKTQRSGAYVNTVADFSADIAKILSLAAPFRQANVLVALAVFQLSAADRNNLRQIQIRGPSGALNYWGWNSQRSAWVDVSADILNAPVGVLMVAAYRAP